MLNTRQSLASIANKNYQNLTSDSCQNLILFSSQILMLPLCAHTTVSQVTFARNPPHLKEKIRLALTLQYRFSPSPSVSSLDKILHISSPSLYTLYPFRYQH